MDKVVESEQSNEEVFQGECFTESMLPLISYYLINMREHHRALCWPFHPLYLSEMKHMKKNTK